jgi:transcriptional regulator GlxA family with amidase domain
MPFHCELAAFCLYRCVDSGPCRSPGWERATTHWAAFDELRAFPQVTVEHLRYVRDGKIMTSAGVSAGIDMALYVTQELYGSKLCEDVTHNIEYPIRDE